MWAQIPALLFIGHLFTVITEDDSLNTPVQPSSLLPSSIWSPGGFPVPLAVSDIDPANAGSRILVKGVLEMEKIP